MGDVHPFGNPHYWLDPENGRVIARAIAAKLYGARPAGRRRVRGEPRRFEAKLTEGEKRWDAALGALRRDRRSSRTTTPGRTS